MTSDLGGISGTGGSSGASGSGDMGRTSDAVVRSAAGADGRVEIVLAGEIDLANATDVGQTIARTITNRTTTAVVDLSGVTYMDSAGLHVLFELAARLPTLQIALELVAPLGSQVRRVMELCGLTSVVAVRPDP
jgi:stage II sporulation protein AA (anti-sigma F factor antagonist)